MTTGAPLNVYVPVLQYAPGIVAYVHRQLGLPIASTAPLARITHAFNTAIRCFAADQGVPWATPGPLAATADALARSAQLHG